MIKEFWSKVAYFWFITMLIIVGFFCGDLFVEAAELTSWASSQTRLTLDNAGSNQFTDFYSTPHTFSDLSIPVKRVQFRVRSSSGLSVENTYTFKFGYLPNPDSLSWGSIQMQKNGDSSLIENNFTCSNVYFNANGYYLTECSISPNYAYSSSDYLWITIFLNGGGGYQTSIRPYMGDYDERLGTNAIITQQGSMINNSINNSSNNIINNNNQNTQSIINNNNQNTQSIINSQTENQKVCNKKIIDKSYVINDGKYLTVNGTAITSTVGNGVTDYIDITNVKDIRLLTILDTEYMCFYNENKVNINCYLETGTITIPQFSKYVRFTINNNPNDPRYNRPQIELLICKNGNQSLNDTLEDDSVDSPNDMIDDFVDMLPTNGTITNLIALPISWYSKILDSINGTCASFNLGSLYGTNLIMPCIELSDYLGSSLLNVIDLMISGFFILKISKKMIKAFNNFTFMKEGDVLSD